MLSNNENQLIISKLSHELRNPLTIIYSRLQLIESKHPEIHGFAHWNDLVQDVEFMNQLLNELTSLNHSDSLSLSDFSLRSFLEYISLAFAASISDTELKYSSKIDSSINQITGDKTKLQELFLNLLKNAADAALPNASVFLHAHAEQEQITITIEDTGCGILKEHLPHIFEPFTTYKPNGTGLGLAIAEHIVKAHHGTITIQSTPGRGTVVQVTLPAHQ